MKRLKEINGFKLYTTKPNTISKGALYTKEVFVNVKNEDKNRLVRVYLPSNYEFDNPNKRFPVMYMMDGKNLFDDHTSFVGEWHVDETIEKYVKLNGKGMIVVGIDSSKDDMGRTNEMLPESKHYVERFEEFEDKVLDGYGSILADYIFNELKPMIDNTFHTLTDKANTGVGGSSMGGLYAFYMGSKFKDKVDFSLCFSPAFLLYKENAFKAELEAKITSPNEFGKYFFFCGGIGLETRIEPLTAYTYNYLNSIGFDSKQVRYIFDSAAVHNEGPWTYYFDVAIKHWGILEK